ncbi:DUF2867 domain-containing protein [Nonomuraea sp. NPDC048826]|uniref:DUF2867 domain-containing protein n=1 Tax=Nonomuraea sp. NPDC048826 TaxID=3364347 RepID=UPI003721A064
MSTRLPDTEHTSRPWRIHDLTRDFHLQDVWAFRTPGGGPDDFATMLAALRASGEPVAQSTLARLLFAARWELGALFGWDEPEQRVGARVPSLRERLPADLRQAPLGPDFDDIPFTNVYELDDEFAMELSNRTVHTICHLGWVETRDGEHELRMAALVKPNGLLGRLYMAAIAPFRHLIVYPALTRQWERAWRDHTAPTVSASTPDPGPDRAVRVAIPPRTES